MRHPFSAQDLETLKPLLGTMTDAQLSDKMTPVLGREISRGSLHMLRKRFNIPAFRAHLQAPKKFQGKLEDVYPEVKDLLGKVHYLVLVEHFQVSIPCLRACADRLQLPIKVQDPTAPVPILLPLHPRKEEWKVASDDTWWYIVEIHTGKKTRIGPKNKKFVDYHERAREEAARRNKE